MTSRRENLIFNAQTDLDAYRTGEISGLSAIDDLAEQAGLASNTARLYLQITGLARERKEAVDEKEVKGMQLPPPGPEFAWLIASLCGGGSVIVNERAHWFKSVSYEKALELEFKNIAERLFQRNAFPVHQRRFDEQGRQYSGYGITSKKAILLGGLRRDSWPEDILDKHHWILEDEAYLWKFIEGYFEFRSGINGEKGKELININSNYRNVVNFLYSILTNVGVDRPAIRRNQATREGVHGINISLKSDLKFVAEHIRSVIPSRENELELLRNL